MAFNLNSIPKQIGWLEMELPTYEPTKTKTNIYRKLMKCTYPIEEYVQISREDPSSSSERSRPWPNEAFQCSNRNGGSSQSFNHPYHSLYWSPLNHVAIYLQLQYKHGGSNTNITMNLSIKTLLLSTSSTLLGSTAADYPVPHDAICLMQGMHNSMLLFLFVS